MGFFSRQGDYVDIWIDQQLRNDHPLCAHRWSRCACGRCPCHYRTLCWPPLEARCKSQKRVISPLHTCWDSNTFVFSKYFWLHSSYRIIPGLTWGSFQGHLGCRRTKRGHLGSGLSPTLLTWCGTCQRKMSGHRRGSCPSCPRRRREGCLRYRLLISSSWC